MIITNGKILTPENEETGKALIIKNGKISGLLDSEKIDLSIYDEVIDAKGGYIVPGFLDIHIHGSMGSDVMDATYEDVEKITMFNAAHGVTTLYLTTVTAPLDTTLRCINNVRKVMEEGVEGSRIMGLHLEGPYLSHSNKGAHLPEYLLEPDLGNSRFIFENSDIIKRITVAPELKGMKRFIKELRAHDIVVSGGHDAAIDHEIIEAIDLGMKHTTHAFCVMSSISRRNGSKHLGLNEMMLLEDELTTEIVADGKHVPTLLAKLIYKCKGADRMCLVSDALRPAGMPKDDTEYMIGPWDVPGGHKIVVDDGVVMLPDRTLYAGSITTVDTMVKSMYESCGIPLIEAVKMATLTPARIMSIDGQKGSLEQGKDADICILDKDLNVRYTIIEGQVQKKNET